MDMQAAKMIGAGLAMLGMIGAGIGIGAIFSNFLNAAARNPSAVDQIRVMTFIGAAFAELLGLLSFVIAILLLFVV
ncbi:MAG: F0F1 ATP synthase subunit C [Alphaproteobacteria bacterium]|nr:MAG: F0F1 ATP synthase subunit C [Alphaproteobacteria bacterium]